MAKKEYRRMLDKSVTPDPGDIDRTLGKGALKKLRELESFLEANYDLVRELRFPFGNGYGWGYKYSHGKKHLLYAFFENGAFTCMLQINGAGRKEIERRWESFQPPTRELWENRYPCGEGGGWIHYRILGADSLDDVYELVRIKCKPPVKR